MVRMTPLAVPFVISASLAAQSPPVNGMRPSDPGPFAIVGGTVVTEPGRRIERGTVLVRDGLVERVGADLAAPAGYRTIDATGLTVYPGLIEPSFLVDSADAQVKAAAGRGAHWNRRIVPQITAGDLAPLDAAACESLRSLGFTIAHVIPEDGIFRGTGSVVLLDETSDRARPLADAPLAAMSFEYGGWSRDMGPGSWDSLSYPSSLMGSMALVRQTLLDARWHDACIEVWRRSPAGNRPPTDAVALAALRPVVRGERPVLIDAAGELDAIRALDLTGEFGLKAVVLGGGTEFRRGAELARKLKGRDASLIVPARLPQTPDVTSPARGERATLRELWTWELAPTNAARLAALDVPFAFTSARLEDRKEFRGNVRQALRHGLDEREALAACTVRPAKLLGIDAVAGTIAPGKLANVLIVDGPLFGDETREPGPIRAALVGGRLVDVEPAPLMPFTGPCSLVVDGREPVPGRLEIRKPSLSFTLADGTKIDAKRFSVRGDSIAFTLDGKALGLEGTARIGGHAVGDAVELRGETAAGPTAAMRLVARTPGPDEKAPEEPKPDEDAVRRRLELAKRPLPFPFTEYGLLAAPAREDVLFRNATVWTAAADGIRETTDVLVQGGKIAAIGRTLEAPPGVRTIDATGRHLTPGLIDCHSHTGISGGVNEGTHSNTAEVTIEDVVDAEDVDWHRALAGGLVAANQLHGSANPIGGRNSVVKIRWGEPESAFPVAKAPTGIKFALGENVVRNRNRYPNTRMGVETWMRDAFAAAAEHAKAHADYAALSADAKARTMPPRPDLELDTLAEILRGERLVHCHSYRQDEILMLLRLAESLGFRIGTLQHILEGYKVGEAIAAHGAGASSFSDWWAYKEEVMDAIPYNGAILHDLGVVVSFNSDSNELARRMNMEAAKAVRYGGLDPHEALKLVTVNPAKQLRIDGSTGSIEVGKDADLVLWTADPLSVYARVDETWVDGTPRFVRADQDAKARAVESERQRLLTQAVAAREEERAKARAKMGEEGDKPDGKSDGKPDAKPTPRGGLLARMLDDREEYLMELVRSGRDPFAVRPGECGCHELDARASSGVSR